MPTDLSQYEAVLLDLDGTIYHEEVALPGAVELIRRLQESGRKYACLTNSTSSPELVAARLNRMGVQVDPLHIYTAAAASCDYVLERFAKNGIKPQVFNLSTDAVHDMLDGKVEWAERQEDACDAVICGVPVNPFATEDRRRTALVHLRKGATLIGICADRVYPSPRGIEFGVGAMAAMLAYAAAVTPIYCGKPETIFFHELCERLHVKPQQCVLIGDNLESDIAGAKAVGMRTILTLTGITTLEDASRAPDTCRPDAVVKDLSELIASA